MLRDQGKPWSVVEELVDSGELKLVEHAGRTFFVRRRGAGTKIAGTKIA
jgi:hypothetical protein